MRVNFLDQPFLLRYIDVMCRNGNVKPYKILDYLGMPSISQETVIAVGRIIKYHEWDQTYEVKPW